MCFSETLCRTYNSTMPTQGQGHSSRSQVWALNFVSALYLLYKWNDFLCQMFTLVRRYAESITQPCLKFGVGSISPLPLEGFSLNVGQMFASVRWCAEPITQLYADSKSRSQLKVTSLSLEFWSRSIAIQTALLNLGQMFALVRWCVEPITQRCRLKVKVTIKVVRLFLVRSTSPEPFERFSWDFGQMFALVRRCAEAITQACRLKVKVTVKGHEFAPWFSCSLHISWTLWKIYIKFGSNVRLSEMMCTTHLNNADSRSRSQLKACSIIILRRGI